MLLYTTLRVMETFQTLRHRPWLGIVVALATAAAALGLRFALGDRLVGVPFLTFFGAIAFTAFLCGPGAGVAAVVFSALFAAYCLMPPFHTFALASASEWIALGFFLVAGSFLVFLTAVMQLAVDRYARAVRELEDAKAELEQRVQSRTRELENANQRLVDEAATRAAAESQVRQMQKMEAVGQLTGGIAHDFNNMLAIIVASLDLAGRQLPAKPDKAVRHIGNALEGAKRAAELTARLLAFSRIQALDPRVLNANRLVSDMSEILQRTLGEETRLETVLAGGLWLVMADSAQIEQAILNICLNSRDAMPSGGRLTLETRNASLDDEYAAAHAEVAPGQYVEIAITDTGQGMTPEVVSRAFEPFYTTKPTGRGSGLGLSQVYGFVNQSGGHVKVYSEPGQGTTVRIYLPRHISESCPAPTNVALEAARSGSGDEVILLVEDDEGVRRTAAATLVELGYAVLEAGTPQQALEILESAATVSLLFTDIVMPDMNGRMLADAARVQRPALKVLYTTGYTRNAVIHNGIVDPGIAVLPKPFTVDQLARKVREVLDGD